jgi:inorganic pyrophosphatase
MNLDRVSPGRRAPQEVNVVIEIPLRSDPVKYEVDKETGAMFVDRFLNTAMHYPCNYGYVPHTLAEDGDPVDVLVITPVPIISGAVVRCRPVGLLRMEDEKGRDDKVLAVPVNELCGLYDGVQSPRGLPPAVLAQVEHFFEHYKDLEAGKWVKVQGWEDAAAAVAQIGESLERYRLAPEKPAF